MKNFFKENWFKILIVLFSVIIIIGWIFVEKIRIQNNACIDSCGKCSIWLPSGFNKGLNSCTVDEVNDYQKCNAKCREKYWATYLFGNE